jgi:hypothetical protein
LKIELDETELTHILDSLHERIDDLADTLTFGEDPMTRDLIAELTALTDDLREASARRDDGWDDIPALDAGAEFIQAGIDARERVKASSRAAERRSERILAGTASPVSNDPIDW